MDAQILTGLLMRYQLARIKQSFVSNAILAGTQSPENATFAWPTCADAAPSPLPRAAFTPPIQHSIRPLGGLIRVPPAGRPEPTMARLRRHACGPPPCVQPGFRFAASNLSCVTSCALSLPIRTKKSTTMLTIRAAAIDVRRPKKVLTASLGHAQKEHADDPD